MALTLSGTNGVVGAGFTLDPSGASVTAGVGTFSSAKVGAAVTITESGIEASGIGITCANINGGSIGGRRNLIINGAMMVAQRGTSSSTNNVYGTVDRMKFRSGDNDEIATRSQITLSSSDTGPYQKGFRKAYRIQNGDQTSGAGAGDWQQFQYTVEAQDIASSGWDYTNSNSFITLSFWIRSSVGQRFYGYLESFDGTGQRYSFAIDGGSALSANTWRFVSIKIPGNSNLQFDNDNGQGLDIKFVTFYGTNYTDNSYSMNNWAATATVNPNYMVDYDSTWYTTNDATWDMTGIQLEVGPEATSFEHRSFGEELELCKRYYQQSYPYALAYPGQTSYTNGNEVFHIDDGNIQRYMVRLHKTMRGASATVVIYNPNTGASDSVRTNDGSNHNPSGAYDIGNNSFFMDVTPSSGEFVSFHWTADTEF